MASCPQGYDEERFATSVNRNFLCLICFNVLRNPVLCVRNQHIFCRTCITKFLENSQRCPTCADELTVETLTEPQRMIKDILNELSIRCKHVNRGCHEIVQLQHLDRHEATCGFTPVVCTNQGCGVTVNKRDQIHHESELCEFRKLKCHSCGEMTKTLTDMEKKIGKMETKMATIETKVRNVEKNIAEMMERKFEAVDNETPKTLTYMEKRMAKIETNMANMVRKTDMENMERNMAKMKTDMEGKLEAANNEVRGLKAALIEGFNEMKEVLIKLGNKKEDNRREVRGGASGDREKENIIVAGGVGTDSVEIFNWPNKTWSQLQSLPKKCYGVSSFVYDNYVTIAGGYCDGPGYVGSMIKMNIDPNPDFSVRWRECPVKLSGKLAFYSSVLYKDQLIVTGGYNGNATFDCIDEVQLLHPYTVKTLSKMLEPRQGHSTEIFDGNLLIVGGRTTTRDQDNLSSVVLYDMKKNEFKQLSPLPYEVSLMATVRWEDNIVVIGGIDKHSRPLDTVIIYNVKTEQHHMLPSMRCKRWGCTAVVIRDNIVVLGGYGERGQLKSVEAFNFDRNTWKNLHEMSEARWWHTAVAV